MNKLVKTLHVFAWAFLTAALLTIPMKDTNYLYWRETWDDKVVHFVIFGTLTFLIIRALREFKLGFKNAGRISFWLVFFYMIFLEYVQEFIPGRDSDPFDILAGLFGVILLIAFEYFLQDKGKEKLLLHICCAGCGAYVAEVLKEEGYAITLYFYNPNLDSREEYESRLTEVKKIAKRYRLKLISKKYNHQAWLGKIKGLEKEGERGRRCLICYRDRLEKTAKKAGEEGFDYFTTTLTISPHKDAAAILNIGAALEKKYKIKFLARDFKKQDGFKKSTCLSRELGIIRQDYCGCEFSKI